MTTISRHRAGQQHDCGHIDCIADQLERWGVEPVDIAHSHVEAKDAGDFNYLRMAIDRREHRGSLSLHTYGDMVELSAHDLPDYILGQLAMAAVKELQRRGEK